MQDPVERLTQGLLEVVALENESLEARGVAGWSAAVSLGVLRALRRWRDTYLMLDLEEYGSDLSDGIVRVACHEGSSVRLLGICLEKVEINLKHWHQVTPTPTQPPTVNPNPNPNPNPHPTPHSQPPPPPQDEEVTEASLGLLASLCDREETRRKLVQQDGWWRLVQLYGQGSLGPGMSRPNGRAVTYAVVRGCYGSNPRWGEVLAMLQAQVAGLQVQGAQHGFDPAALTRLGDTLRATAKAAAATMREEALLFAASFAPAVQEVPSAAVRAGHALPANAVLKYYCELLDAVGALDVEAAVGELSDTLIGTSDTLGTPF